MEAFDGQAERLKLVHTGFESLGSDDAALTPIYPEIFDFSEEDQKSHTGLRLVALID